MLPFSVYLRVSARGWVSARDRVDRRVPSGKIYFDAQLAIHERLPLVLVNESKNDQPNSFSLTGNRGFD